MERISVIGTSGSGKTTTAARLAAILDLPHLEFDSVFHQPDWTPLPDEEFQARIGEFTSSDRWIVDGNYTSHGTAGIVWPRADTVVWLDLPRTAVMRRVVSRTIRRAVTREELWNGNREPLTNFYSTEPEKNIILWAWTRHGPVRDKYEAFSNDGTWDHLDVHRLRSQGEIDALLEGLTATLHR